MAERKLKSILDKIIKDAVDKGYAQSDRHVSDSLVTFTEIDDILKTWYESQWRITTGGSKTRMGPTIDQDWNKLRKVRKGAYKAYKRGVLNALAGKSYGRQLASKPDDIVWRYYSWVGKKAGVTARKAHQQINKTGMAAMALYVDKYWKQAEKKKTGRSSYISTSAHHTPGSGSTAGTFTGYTAHFAHGVPAGLRHKGSAEYGSTTGTVGVLEEILSGELRNKFEAANPVIDSFITDITEMFIMDANIQIVDTSPLGGHKNTIIIKGYVTSKRNNSQKMKNWDRDTSGHTGIQKRLQEVMDNTLEGLIEVMDAKGTLAGFDIFDISASPTQAEIIVDKGVRVVLKEIKKTNPRAVITFAKKKVKQKKKSTAKTSSKKKTIKRTVRSTKVRPIAPIKSKSATPISRTVNRGAQNATSPIGLVALLNRSLPAQVAKNMAPIRGFFPKRLTWRTGRFADSAEVTNIVPFKSSVEIRYTYQKDPYAIFEQGSGDPRATGPSRDPREIIGQSVREAAQSIMGTKFGLVRTKRV